MNSARGRETEARGQRGARLSSARKRDDEQSPKRGPRESSTASETRRLQLVPQRGDDFLTPEGRPVQGVTAKSRQPTRRWGRTIEPRSRKRYCATRLFPCVSNSVPSDSTPTEARTGRSRAHTHARARRRRASKSIELAEAETRPRASRPLLPPLVRAASELITSADIRVPRHLARRSGTRTNASMRWLP